MLSPGLRLGVQVDSMASELNLIGVSSRHQYNIICVAGGAKNTTDSGPGPGLLAQARTGQR